MPVDPNIAALLQLLEGAQPVWEQDPVEGREGFRLMTVGARQPAHVVPVGSVEETTVPGAEGDLVARVYRPEGTGPWPTVAFFHGGGFVIGDLDTHDNLARAICRRTPAVVVSVDYRLAPEHPFPAGAEDAVAATRWIQDHLGDLGGDDRLAVAGDSAGGNLSAVVTQAVPGLAAQLLIYPATDGVDDDTYPSREENATGYLLDEPTMRWFMEHYAADPADVRFSPIRGTLEGLPPAVVMTAGFDPLRDEGDAYAAALEAAGVRVVHRRYDAMIHGFADFAAVSPGAQEALDDGLAAFAELLA